MLRNKQERTIILFFPVVHLYLIFVKVVSTQSSDIFPPSLTLRIKQVFFCCYTLSLLCKYPLDNEKQHSAVKQLVFYPGSAQDLMGFGVPTLKSVCG